MVKPNDAGAPAKPKDPKILNRLLARGATALTEAELVAMLVRDGKDGRPALESAQDLLGACGGLFGLLSCDLAIARAQALDDVQAASILAAVELSRRLTAAARPAEVLEDPGLVARHLYLQYSRVHQQVIGALFLNLDCHLIGQVEVFRGDQTRLFVAARPILVEAIRHGASGVLLFSIRPSGAPTPSRENLRFTYRVRDACELVNLTLHDHLVIAGSRWISIRRLYPRWGRDD